MSADSDELNCLFLKFVGNKQSINRNGSSMDHEMYYFFLKANEKEISFFYLFFKNENYEILHFYKI